MENWPCEKNNQIVWYISRLEKQFYKNQILYLRNQRKKELSLPLEFYFFIDTCWWSQSFHTSETTQSRLSPYTHIVFVMMTQNPIAKLFHLIFTLTSLKRLLHSIKKVRMFCPCAKTIWLQKLKPSIWKQFQRTFCSSFRI